MGLQIQPSPLKIVYEDRVHKFKRTQGEIERKLKLLNKIFAFITIEITKFIRSVLPGTDHLLSNKHFCVLTLPALASTIAKSVFFFAQKWTSNRFFAHAKIVYFFVINTKIYSSINRRSHNTIS